MICFYIYSHVSYHIPIFITTLIQRYTIRVDITTEKGSEELGFLFSLNLFYSLSIGRLVLFKMLSKSTAAFLLRSESSEFISSFKISNAVAPNDSS